MAKMNWARAQQRERVWGGRSPQERADEAEDLWFERYQELEAQRNARRAMRAGQGKPETKAERERRIRATLRIDSTTLDRARRVLRLTDQRYNSGVRKGRAPWQMLGMKKKELDIVRSALDGESFHDRSFELIKKVAGAPMPMGATAQRSATSASRPMAPRSKGGNAVTNRNAAAAENSAGSRRSSPVTRSSTVPRRRGDREIPFPN